MKKKEKPRQGLYVSLDVGKAHNDEADRDPNYFEDAVGREIHAGLSAFWLVNMVRYLRKENAELKARLALVAEDSR